MTLSKHHRCGNEMAAAAKDSESGKSWRNISNGSINMAKSTRKYQRSGVGK